ncbi:MAG: hypothetical protein RR828_07360 [Oscillospiraceae bacterium]
MSATDQSFRGAAFGGFNRQDVMRYIEASSKEHSAKLSQLKKALETEKKTREELENQMASAGIREDDSTGRAQRAEEHLAETNSKLNTAMAELEEKTARLTAAERELADLREQVERFAPEAIAYEGLKDRCATIELEAHQRAQAVEDASIAAAEATHAQLTAWVEKVRGSYGRLCQDVSATLTHADSELIRAQHSLDGVSDEFAGHDAALEAIVNAYETVALPKELVSVG